jgi:hypothetical protein
MHNSVFPCGRVACRGRPRTFGAAKMVGPPIIPLLGLSTARGGVPTSRTAMANSQKCQLCRRTTVNDVVESHKCHSTNVLDDLS